MSSHSSQFRQGASSSHEVNDSAALYPGAIWNLRLRLGLQLLQRNVVDRAGFDLTISSFDPAVSLAFYRRSTERGRQQTATSLFRLVECR